VEVVLPEFDGASPAHDIDEQARRFEVCVSGCVDERQPKLTAVFRDLPSNVGGDQQLRFAQGLTLSLDYRRRRESVDCFYFGSEKMFATARFNFDHRVGYAVPPRCRRLNMGFYPSGFSKGGDSGVQDASLVGRHGGTLRVQ
jgi:hypothetical protein